MDRKRFHINHKQLLLRRKTQKNVLITLLIHNMPKNTTFKKCIFNGISKSQEIKYKKKAIKSYEIEFNIYWIKYEDNIWPWNYWIVEKTFLWKTNVYPVIFHNPIQALYHLPINNWNIRYCEEWNFNTDPLFTEIMNKDHIRHPFNNSSISHKNFRGKKLFIKNLE